MARNVEIKARIAGVEALAPMVAAVADEGPMEIHQDDTFFACEAGRLKLRVLSAEAGELIFYRRADLPGPKESFYVRAPAPAPDALRRVLSLAYAEVGRVRKRRRVFLAGRTRIHLDVVDGLGHFLELEVVLEDGEDAEVGAREARELLARLGVEESSLIEGSYLDLLSNQEGPRSAGGD